MVLGVPVFGPDAPPERVKGRRIGNWFANLETLWGGVHDSLFGFRVYPLKPAVRIMESIRTARRFDFDTELVVRLFWAGVRPINQPVPVHYPPRVAGGVTHFKYLRDNLLLAGTHTRLCLLMLTAPLAGLETAKTMETRHLVLAGRLAAVLGHPGDARTGARDRLGHA